MNRRSFLKACFGGAAAGALGVAAATAEPKPRLKLDHPFAGVGPDGPYTTPRRLERVFIARDKLYPYLADHRWCRRLVLNEVWRIVKAESRHGRVRMSDPISMVDCGLVAAIDSAGHEFSGYAIDVFVHDAVSSHAKPIDEWIRLLT